MNLKFFKKIIFLSTIFLLFVFTFTKTVFSQSEAEKLGFPYAINFSKTEINYLKKLPKSKLQKLIDESKKNMFDPSLDRSVQKGGLLGGQTAGKGLQQPNTLPANTTNKNPQNPILGTPSQSPPGSQSQNSPQNQDGNQPIKEPGGASKDTTKECGGGKESSDSEFKGMLKSAGIKFHASATFGGILTDSLTMLKELETDCKCKIFITSAVRAGMPHGGMHGPGARYFDLGFTPEFTSFIKSKGSGGPCWYTYKGIKMLDEKLCPSKNATGPHWHINGKGWDCGKK